MLSLVYILLLPLAAQSAVDMQAGTVQLEIKTTWDSEPVESPTLVTLSKDSAGLGVHVEAKFWNDPPKPNGKEGQAFFRLWDYEVVELFLLNEDGQYIEIELGPWGQHIVLLLDKGKDLRHSLPISYTANRQENKWSGNAVIPHSYLPPNIIKLNAYAIHGSGDKRVYEALFPAPKGVHDAPSFHRLEYFQHVDLSKVLDQKTQNLSKIWEEALVGKQSYKIGLTWDGKPVDHIPAELTLQGNQNVVEITITAPYFKDPAPPGGKPGETYNKLWEYEVVEAFFLNDKEQYLELEFGPHGQHLALLLNGRRNAIRNMLPLDYTASINEDQTMWTGFARIPIQYFPPNVSLFNAYAIHGSGSERVYEALYESSGPNPDFHRLEKFQPIDFQYLVPDNKEAKLSDIWESSIAVTKTDCTSKVYTIDSTWNGDPVDHNQVEISLTSCNDDDSLLVDISAPFFDDPSPEGGKPGEAFFKLWDYEVVEAFFLNEKDQYLEVEFGPHGQHLALLLDGRRNAIKHSLPLVYSATVDRGNAVWKGRARIPSTYFPPDVVLFNAYAIHGQGEKRIYEALYEVSGEAPDFHKLEKFQRLEFGDLMPQNQNAELSALWKTAIAESVMGKPNLADRREFEIKTTWDGKPVDHQPVKITLIGADDDLIIEIKAPYFDDPAPEGKPGEAFFKLWEYEVVETFFLNDADQYLELEFGPHGQHLSLLLNGNRNAIKHSLPIDYTATIDESKQSWKAKARIPGIYFPPNVTKFNAFAIYGTGDQRKYEALYEVSGPQPDFHRLEKYQPLDFNNIVENNVRSNFSALWATSIAESQIPQTKTLSVVKEFRIENTWNNQPVDHEPVQIRISGVHSDLIIQIRAPFFDDPAPEDTNPGEAFYKLWDYEVVEAFFLNDANQYLELEFGPHGQHLALLLNGRRNAVKHSLALVYNATIDRATGIWEAEARVPSSYFPPNVSKFNAYAIHGVGKVRVYEALYEVSGPQPDFHRLEKFQPLDLGKLLEDNKSKDLSAVWRQAIYEI